MALKELVVLCARKSVVSTVLIASVGALSEALGAGVVGTGTPASCTEEALDTALAGGGEITFNCGAAPATITVTQRKVISAATSVDGASTVRISGGLAVPVFAVDGATFTVENLTIADGRNSTTSGGGGILNFGGQLTLRNSTLSGNYAILAGGGISNTNGGTVTVVNSTLSDNRCENIGTGGGGIATDGGTVTVANCTFSGNSGPFGSGILTVSLGPFSATTAITNSTFVGNTVRGGRGAVIERQVGGTVTLTNSIVANGDEYLNCGGVVMDGGHNLQFPATTCGETIPSVDPLLDPGGLKNNGGPTLTIALLSNSPAANAGDDAACAAPPVSSRDQRGFTRPGQGQTHCSIGAFELNDGGSTPVATHTPTNTPTQQAGTPTHTPPPPNTATSTSTAVVTASGTATATGGPTTCVGDCGGTNSVSISDLVLGVNIALGSSPPSVCPAFQDAQGEVTIAQLISGVNNALNGCPAAARNSTTDRTA